MPCLTNPPGIQRIQQLVLKAIQALVGLEGLSLGQLSLSLYWWHHWGKDALCSQFELARNVSIDMERNSRLVYWTNTLLLILKRLERTEHFNQRKTAEQNWCSSRYLRKDGWAKLRVKMCQMDLLPKLFYLREQMNWWKQLSKHSAESTHGQSLQDISS